MLWLKIETELKECKQTTETRSQILNPNSSFISCKIEFLKFDRASGDSGKLEIFLCFSDDDEEHPRPSSAASSRSLPSSKRWRKKKAKQPSEVGIRNVAAYKGHQVMIYRNPKISWNRTT